MDKDGESSNGTDAGYGASNITIAENAVNLAGNNPMILGVCGSANLQCNAITYTWLQVSGSADFNVETN